MALDLQDEFEYLEKPLIPVRVRSERAAIDTEVLLDTGASVSLFDAALAELLGLRLRAADTMRVVGVTGATGRIPFARLEVVVVGMSTQSPTLLAVGFLPGLAISVGNLLGRDFLESVHLGLDHRNRRLYLGAPPRR